MKRLRASNQTCIYALFSGIISPKENQTDRLLLHLAASRNIALACQRKMWKNHLQLTENYYWTDLIRNTKLRFPLTPCWQSRSGVIILFDILFPFFFCLVSFRKVWLVCVSMALLGIAISAYQVPCMPDMLETARYLCRLWSRTQRKYFFRMEGN